jgi:uncharacterized protein YegL
LSGNAEQHQPIQMRVEKTVATIKLNASELEQLGRHDITLLIDKSESMRTPDCPSLERPLTAVSRWDWCRQQSTDLAAQTASVLPDGLTVVVFSNFARAFPHVNANVIPQIFAANQPGGMTNEAYAVHMVLDDYFNRRKQQHNKVRPMLIAVITDGLPTNTFALKRELFEATEQMKHQGEIGFTFLQVGGDPQGIGFICDLEASLQQEHAKYDIVTSRTFPELIKTGLAKALYDCIAPADQRN